MLMGVKLRSHVTNLGPIERASAFILNADPRVRVVCVAARSHRIMGPGGAMRFTRSLDDYFAPDDVYSVYRGMIRFVLFKQATRTMGFGLFRPTSMTSGEKT